MKQSRYFKSNTLFDISTFAEMKTRQVMCYAQIFNFASKFGLKRTKFGCKIKYLSVAHHLPRFHFSESRYVKESIQSGSCAELAFKM